MMLTQNRSDGTEPYVGLNLSVPDLPRILIVCENDSDRERLKTVFGQAGLSSESAKNITAGCEAAKAGRFEVIFSTLLMADGSWKRLIDVAQHYDLSFEIVLLAPSFNLSQWTEALQDGAFDVLDVVYDLPKAAEAAKRASGAAYLRRFRARPEQV